MPTPTWGERREPTRRHHGVGAVAPGGIGRDAYWDLLAHGRTATRRISRFDASAFRSQVAAECDFDPVAAGLSPQEVRRMDRAAQFAVVAAQEAIEDSGIDVGAGDPGRTAVSIGSAVGCTTGLEDEYAVLSDGGRNWLVDHTYGVPHLYGYMVRARWRPKWPGGRGRRARWR